MDDPRPALLLSFDLEDWHQLVHRRLGAPDWDRRHTAFERQVRAILSLLDELEAKATFFLLGMTVANYPELAAELAARGHDPACHGYAHARVHDQTPAEFRADVERSAELIECATGKRPSAFRAPAFSINRRTPWAYDVLAELGFRCDSSQYDSPRVPDRLGAIPHAPYTLELGSGRELLELPVAVWGSLPIGGGSYWRVLPTRVLRRGLRAVGERSAYPVLYFHPYELDTELLRTGLPSTASARQRLTAGARSLWRNAGRTLVARRLRELEREFRLLSFEQAYADIANRYGTSTRALSEEGVLF